MAHSNHGVGFLVFRSPPRSTAVVRSVGREARRRTPPGLQLASVHTKPIARRRRSGHCSAFAGLRSIGTHREVGAVRGLEALRVTHGKAVRTTPGGGSAARPRAGAHHRPAGWPRVPIHRGESRPSPHPRKRP